jgi:uncharacterized protein YggT (Ycf19 family)
MSGLAASATYLVRWLFDLYVLVLLVRVVLSWLRLPPWHWAMRTVGAFCYALTEPLLAPLRGWLAPYQRGTGLDFSPLLLYALLAVARALLERLLRTLL